MCSIFYLHVTTRFKKTKVLPYIMLTDYYKEIVSLICNRNHINTKANRLSDENNP